MSFRFSSVGIGILLLGLVITGESVQSARGQGTQRSKRDFSSSETNTADVFRSLNQLGTKTDGLKRLEDELNKSSLPFSRNSLDSEPVSSGPLPIAPVVQTRRKKTDLTHTDGWLNSSEEMLPAGATEDTLGFPGFESDKKDPKKASWEKLYQKVKQDDSRGTGLGSTAKSNGRQAADSDEDDSDMPSAIRDNAQLLKKQLSQSDFGASIFSSPNSRANFSDFFGVGATGLTPEQAKAHKNYMDSYVTSVFGDANPTVSSGTTGKSPAYSPLSSLPTVAKSDTFNPNAGTSGRLLTAPAQDLNSSVLNQWNPMYNPEPKLEVPKPQPFFTPPMEIPRRRF